jgi:diacylglycerol kinase family enzyme
VNLPSTPMSAASGWRPVDPPRRPVLFVNPRSGGGKAARADLAERARERGVEAVILDPGQDLAALARGAAAGGADALGVAGGDGSLAVVAAEHGIAFACVPAGTRNHFALDVGVDRHDLTGALDAFTDGVERQIDVAEVNGRMFLNNVSLGIYGEAVRQPAYRDAKVRTLLATAEEVLGPSGEAPALRLVDDAGREQRNPAVVLVSNNPYALDNPLAPGTRPALDTGRLGIVVLGVPGDTSLRPGQAWTAPRLEVSAPAAVHAGVDGEAADLSPPLRFAIRPAALRVRISSRHPGASPSARLRLPSRLTPPRGSQDQLSDQVCNVISVLNIYSMRGYLAVPAGLSAERPAARRDAVMHVPGEMGGQRWRRWQRQAGRREPAGWTGVRPGHGRP